MRKLWIGCDGVAAAFLLLTIVTTQAMAQQSPPPSDGKAPASNSKLITNLTPQQPGSGGTTQQPSSGSWQQMYCQATPPPPGSNRCINKCPAGTYPDGPAIINLKNPPPPGQEPNCRCVADGTTLSTTITPSYVHVHSVTTPQGTTIIDGSSPGSPVVTVGQRITLNGCNFGDSGIVKEQSPNNGDFQLALPTPMGANWSSSAVTLSVSPNTAANLYPDGSYGGAIEVQAPSGLSNQVYMQVNCPTPTIAGIGPTAVQPGGSSTFTGCGFGAIPGKVFLSVPGTTVSTMNGSNAETYQILPGTGWGGTSVTFQVPSNIAPGTYNLSVGVPQSSSPTTTYTTAAWDGSMPIAFQVLAPSSQIPPPSTTPTFGIINTQTQQFTPSQTGTSFYSTPFVSLWPPSPNVSGQNGLTSSSSTGPDIQGISPAGGSVWVATNMQTSIPVQVQNYGPSTTVQLVIWQDANTGVTPQVCDPSGPTDASPDGNNGSWVNLGNPVTVPSQTPLKTIYIPATLNPGANFLSLAGPWGYSAYKISACGSRCMANSPVANTNANIYGEDGSGHYLCQTPGQPFVSQSGASNVYPNNLLGTWAQEVTVVPVYTATLDAIPYTILYAPPGDLSKASLTDNMTSSIQYKAAGTNKTSNSSNDVQNTCFSAGLTVFGLGPDGMECQNSTNNGETDLATQWTATVQSSTGHGVQWQGQQIKTLVPGRPALQGYSTWPESYDNEPFWYDGFVFELSPQYAVYNNNGTAVFELLPTTAPTFTGLVPLALLAACAAGLPTPTGTGLPPASADPCNIGGVTLTPQEALSALSLDPFYPNGQSVDPTGGCVPSTIQGCRVVPMPNYDYVENGASVTASYTASTQLTGETDLTTTYIASTSNVQQTTINFKGNLASVISGIASSVNPSSSGGGGGPVSATIGYSNTNTQTQTAGVSLTYVQSTIANSQQSAADSVQLQDGDNSSNNSTNCSTCHPPLAPGAPDGQLSPIAYWDSTFGTILFRDPNSPGPPPGDYTVQLKKLLPGVLKKMPPYLQPVRPVVAKPIQKTGGN